MKLSRTTQGREIVKLIKMIRLTVFLGMIGTAMSARADSQQRLARFKAAISACQNSELNKTAKVVFPTPEPGQRPQFTPDQKALFKECVQAGIIPHHRWQNRQTASQQ